MTTPLRIARNISRGTGEFPMTREARVLLMQPTHPWPEVFTCTICTEIFFEITKFRGLIIFLLHTFYAGLVSWLHIERWCDVFDWLIDNWWILITKGIIYSLSLQIASLSLSSNPTVQEHKQAIVEIEVSSSWTHLDEPRQIAQLSAQQRIPGHKVQ